MKKILSILLVISLLCALCCGCEKVYNAEISLIIDDVLNENAEEIQYDIKKKLGENDISYVVKNGSGDISQQNILIQESIDEGVKFIVFIPLSYYGYEDVITQAVEHGIQVIVLEHDVNCNEEIIKIVPDRVNATKELLDNFSSKYEMNSVLEVQCDTRKSYSEISTTFKKHLTSIGVTDYKVIENVQNRFDSQNKLQDYMYDKDANIDIIFAHTNEIAMGAIDLLTRTNDKKKKLICLESNDNVLKSIVTGHTLMCVDFDKAYGDKLISIYKSSFTESDLEVKYVIVDTLNVNKIKEDNLYEQNN